MSDVVTRTSESTTDIITTNNIKNQDSAIIAVAGVVTIVSIIGIIVVIAAAVFLFWRYKCNVFESSIN